MATQTVRGIDSPSSSASRLPSSGAAIVSEERFASLAMGTIVERAGARRDCRVLDLGPGIGANVEFLSAFSSRIFIEDLYQTLSSIGPFTGDARAYCPVFSGLLPYLGQKPFDLIFLWSLLDYLDRDDIQRLASHLIGISTRGTLIHALISTRRSMPAMPETFKIIDNSNLCGRRVSAAEIACPRHSQVRLLEWMRGLRAKRSYLLRNGMQEYIFEVASAY
jgi:hypothetical protein